jgi:hypothetical protein
MDQLQSEAEANYCASRWEDSAKTYEHLVGLAQQNSELEKAIGFALAAIEAWSKLPNMLHRINRLYQAVGLIGIKKAAIGFEKIAEQAEKENDLKNAASHFEEAGNNYNLIQSFDKVKRCYQAAAAMFEKLHANANSDKDFETSIHLMNRICSLYTKLGTIMERLLIERKDFDSNAKQKVANEKNAFYQKAQVANKQKAKAHENLAQFYLSKNEPDCNRIAEKEYKTAIEILESLGETKEAKKIKGKLEKIPK